MTAPLFSFEHVRVPGEGRDRLDDVTVEILDGRLTVIVGPSGSGKSTFLRLGNLLEVPDSGVVRYRGVDLANADAPSHRRRVGMLFQQAVPFEGSVLDNLRVADRRIDRDRAEQLLDRVHLTAHYLDREATQLSGGEAQRICLARVLATEPDALLVDEPTSALDPEPKLALEALARELCDDGVPTVWVTHDLDQMNRLADGIVVLIDGRVVHSACDRPFDAGASDSALHFLETRP